MMSCEGELSEIIRETHSVEDMAFSPSSGKIFFSGSVKDSTGLFTFNLKNEKVNDVNICSERDCTQIALDPTEKYLAYSTIDQGGQVVLRNLATRNAVLVEKAPAGFMDFSLDGTYFRYYSLNTNTLNHHHAA